MGQIWPTCTQLYQTRLFKHWVPKSDDIPLLQIDGRQIERVSHFKICLLGLQLSDNLLWDLNVEYVCNKISSKLHFVKLLKRTGLSTGDLQYFYITVIRPISEYASTLWNHNLTSTFSDQLESYQFFFFPRLISAAVDWMSAILHMAWP